MEVSARIALMSMRELQHEVVRLTRRRDELSAKIGFQSAKLSAIRNAIGSGENAEADIAEIKNILTIV